MNLVHKNDGSYFVDADIQVVELLLKLGFKVDCKDLQGNFPLDVALTRGQWPVVSALLGYHAPSTALNHAESARFEDMIEDISLHQREFPGPNANHASFGVDYHPKTPLGVYRASHLIRYCLKQAFAPPFSESDGQKIIHSIFQYAQYWTRSWAQASKDRGRLEIQLSVGKGNVRMLELFVLPRAEEIAGTSRGRELGVMALSGLRNTDTTALNLKRR